MTTGWQPGYYRGDVVGWVFPMGKKNDVEIHLTVDILDANGVPTGNKRTVYLYTTEKAWPHTERKLRFLGWNGATDESATFTNCSGVELSMRSEAYQGKQQEKWDLAPPPKENAPADSLGRLAARFRAGGPVPRPSSPRPPAPAPKPPPTSGPKGASTKDEAWAVWCQVSPGTAGPDATKWQRAIDTVGGGKPDAGFTAADWQAVADEAIPI